MMSVSSRRFKATVAVTAILIQLSAAAVPADAFCGFYVAQADSKLFNRASKVVLSWDDGTAAVTMANDYQGDPKEFAIVVPVPTFIERKQIGIVDMKTVDHLDAFTAPRLVEYTDLDPCLGIVDMEAVRAAMPASPPQSVLKVSNSVHGVTVEATYDVGEYDVSILSAQQSDGLVQWLTENGYKLPEGAAPVLGSYIKQKMHFFIAKVNLNRMKQSGNGFLRPLQVRYETNKFMLPIRLGTLNAEGPQDLVILALSRHGRIETSNYRTVKLPTGMELPLYVKDEFGDFYKSMFDRQVRQQNMSAVFLEYAWDMGWCDPCAAAPLTNKEMVELGARWIGNDNEQPYSGGDAFVTRLHVRYDAQHFPEDLAFLETRDRATFQGRYALRHPWQGTASCSAAETYRQSLAKRFNAEADALRNLTDWQPEVIRARMEASGESLGAKPAR
jgi:hypothetical protein